MVNYKIGEINEMMVKREASFGVYLEAGSGSTNDDVLLPRGSMVGEAKIGDLVPVFIYRDSEDRIIATMKQPLITVGEVKKLKVVGANQSGAFVNIGLERDVFVPKKEQKYDIEIGQDYLFKLYVDKTERLCATTDVNGALLLPPEDKFQKNETVNVTILTRQQNGVLQAAIDDTYKAVLFKEEYFTEVNPGDTVQARILKFLDDGKPSLTLRSDLKTERLDLKQQILKEVKDAGGSIPYNDKSTPEEIKRKFNTSKNYFKIALGNLMKTGKVIQDETGIHLNPEKIPAPDAVKPADHVKKSEPVKRIDPAKRTEPGKRSESAKNPSAPGSSESGKNYEKRKPRDPNKSPSPVAAKPTEKETPVTPKTPDWNGSKYIKKGK
ncbi:MAG: S1-like domain-containing RNA-binding protein [Clostridiaceae bacterium]